MPAGTDSEQGKAQPVKSLIRKMPGIYLTYEISNYNENKINLHRHNQLRASKKLSRTARENIARAA
jgi:hypothetical protein